MITNREVYVDGRRIETPALDEMQDICDERDGLAWIGLEDPSEEELNAIADEFGFHPLAVEDTLEANQRPKLEHYGAVIFVVLRTARYIDESETVDFGEIHLFVGRDFIVTVRQRGTKTDGVVKRRLEDEPELLAHGPLAVMYAIMDHVVDGYGPVLDGLENDIDEIETEVFAGTRDSAVSQRIYLLSRQVIRLHRVTRPMHDAMDDLRKGRLSGDREISRYLRDVHDHATRANDRVEALRDLISNILTVNLAMIGAEQNNQTKKISAWAAILIVPTIITGIYGMNFDFMPELHAAWGYPAALILILAISIILYRVFKRRGWL